MNLPFQPDEDRQNGAQERRDGGLFLHADSQGVVEVEFGEERNVLKELLGARRGCKEAVAKDGDESTRGKSVKEGNLLGRRNNVRRTGEQFLNNFWFLTYHMEVISVDGEWVL